MRGSDDTICAPATGRGGAISIIRISGQDTFRICGKVFFPAGKKLNLSEEKGHTVIYGEIRNENELIDDVLLTVFRKPHSYTGEDSAEISCHASSYIIRKILEILIRNGARAATQGEFTQRAFMNGRMDLSQAEAVADIIASSSKAAHRIAMNQMRGGFSSEVGQLRSELLHFASLIELELDFGEEDVEFADRAELKAIVQRVKNLTDKLADSFMLGNAVKNGIPVAIIGKPNSGKSTLLNALLKEERAIVSEIPGTTRDTIEDTMVIDGLEYRFIDTAGIRETSDVIETIGIRRTYEKISQASIVLLVDEISDTPESVNKRADKIREHIDGQRLFILINKIDEAQHSYQKMFSENITLRNSEKLLFISAREKTGIEELKAELGDASIKEKIDSNEVIVSNVRHYDSLVQVSSSLGRVMEGLETGVPEDLIAIDIRQAIHYLGEITGQITTDEILGNIFKNFCIGK